MSIACATTMRELEHSVVRIELQRQAIVAATAQVDAQLSELRQSHHQFVKVGQVVKRAMAEYGDYEARNARPHELTRAEEV
jgi:hypothetical protein